MPNINEKAVDQKILLADGSHKQLKTFWKNETVVLVFLRHFG